MNDRNHTFIVSLHQLKSESIRYCMYLNLVAEVLWKMHCPYYKKDDKVIKRGKRKNKYVKKQQYWCNGCEKYFVSHDGFQGMTYPKKIIVKALHLYGEGLSLSKTRDYIWQHEGFYLYDCTILYWVKKYADLLSNFESSLKPKVRGRIHTDETYVKMKGEGHYSVDSIDSGTKYDLATTFTKHRSKLMCRKHFKKLKVKIGDQVKDVWKKEKDKPVNEKELITFVSDKFEGYKIGFNYCFHMFGRLVHGVPIACKKYGLEHNNNAIERLNEDFKQRYKVTRGCEIGGKPPITPFRLRFLVKPYTPSGLRSCRIPARRIQHDSLC